MLIRLNWSEKKNRPLILRNLHLKCIKYTTNHTNVMRITFYDFITVLWYRSNFNRSLISLPAQEIGFNLHRIWWNMTTITLVNEQNSTGNPFLHICYVNSELFRKLLTNYCNRSSMSQIRMSSPNLLKTGNRKDVVQLDIYRNALEAVLFQTPDDI